MIHSTNTPFRVFFPLQLLASPFRLCT